MFFSSLRALSGILAPSVCSVLTAALRTFGESSIDSIVIRGSTFLGFLDANHWIKDDIRHLIAGSE